MKTFLRNKHYANEPVWHVQIAMALAIALQLLLPDHYVFFSRYLLITIELLLMVALSFTTPKQPIFKSFSRRLNVFLLIFLTSLANSYSLIQVARALLETGHVNNGRELIITAINIYLTNIIIFGLWYWEMDGGGPGERRQIISHAKDFLFPQDQNPSYRYPGWQPTFIDYLYLSATNGMAFSPTDTLPMSRRAKMLMLGQATISLVAVALVAARAVNILG